MRYDVVIAGGGTGGIAAALAAARMGANVLIVEELSWLGGQLTSQAVQPDENPVIEDSGSTRLYRLFRAGVRHLYAENFPLLREWRKDPNLNPGNGTVSKICFLPRVGLAALHSFLAVYAANQQIRILTHHKLIDAEIKGDYIKSLTFENMRTGRQKAIEAPYFIDATELGDVLDKAAVEHLTGAEARKDTGEPLAPEKANPLDIEAITWAFAIDYIPGEDYTIEKPRTYDFWKNYHPPGWPGPQLGWDVPVKGKLAGPDYQPLFQNNPDGTLGGMWFWRRILDKSIFEPDYFKSDITVVNWMHIDYWRGPIYGVGEEQVKKNLDEAKELSLSFMYWMQTEAPTFDGKSGYKGLRLRGDVTGGEHGLAKYPYIRESRRIKAEFTIVQQMIDRSLRAAAHQAEQFADTVGVGFYNIDLHPTTNGTSTINLETYPFQIPLGALLPVRVENLLAGAKNIGTTHITNGAYRLHPIEWNIGESAGYLIVFCVKNNVTPRQVRNTPKLLRDFQREIVKMGVMLEWPPEYRDFEFK